MNATSIPASQSLGKVAVMMGGWSAEREISLMSGTGVLEALQSKGVEAHKFDPAEDNIFELKQQGFERCFINLHGRYGEDGTVQGALELLGIPYTGPGVMASSVGINKIMTKRIWLADDIPTPAYWQIEGTRLETKTSAQQAIDAVGLPMVIKAPYEGSSIGVYKAYNPEQVEKAMQAVAAIDTVVLCEALIEGEEYTCPIIGHGASIQALPLIHISAPDGNYDYQQKYFGEAVQYHCPCDLPHEVHSHLQAQALRAYEALSCRGWSRVDVILRKTDNQAFFLEINTSPGMTAHSLVPMAARAIGMEYADLCVHILAQARLDYREAAL